MGWFSRNGTDHQAMIDDESRRARVNQRQTVMRMGRGLMPSLLVTRSLPRPVRLFMIFSFFFMILSFLMIVDKKYSTITRDQEELPLY
jgi:hypothetical protein